MIDWLHDLRFGITLLGFYAKRGTVHINGEPFRIPRQLLPVFSVRRNNSYEPTHVEFMRRMLQAGQCYVDVGANVGVLSAEAGRIVGPAGRVVAYEPNPFIFPTLVEFLRLNGLADTACALPLAVTETTGTVEFSVIREISPVMARSGILYREGEARRLTVLCTSLDQSLGGLKRVDMIKIDVEGAEIRVLQGARNLIRGQHPVVFVEIHGNCFEHRRDVIEPVFSFFNEMGFSAWNLAKRGSETAGGFLASTGMLGRDPLTGRSYAESGYGHVVFASPEYSGAVRSALEGLRLPGAVPREPDHS